ncbi:MAG: DinB family protein [Acidobacteria bacterium]|nr:DinB family protein [Acidobacteriota bacterium]
MTSEPTRSRQHPDTPSREAIHAEFETARATFHAALRSLGEAGWRRKSANPAWTNAEVLAHAAGYLTLLPRFVSGARKGKGFPRPPLLASRWLSIWLARWAARNTTPRSLARTYEAGHATALILLAGIRDDEWHNGATFPSGYQTVESFFRIHARHVAEHAAQLRVSSPDSAGNR